MGSARSESRRVAVTANSNCLRNVGHLDACRPEERLMIGGMARDDGRLARPLIPTMFIQCASSTNSSASAFMS